MPSESEVASITLLEHHEIVAGFTALGWQLELSTEAEQVILVGHHAQHSPFDYKTLFPILRMLTTAGKVGGEWSGPSELYLGMRYFMIGTLMGVQQDYHQFDEKDLFQ